MIYENASIELKDKTFKLIKDIQVGDVLKHGQVVKNVIQEKLTKSRICVRMSDSLIVDQNHLIATRFFRNSLDFTAAINIRLIFLHLVEKDNFMYNLEFFDFDIDSNVGNKSELKGVERKRIDWFEVEGWFVKSFSSDFKDSSEIGEIGEISVKSKL
jgi:hypothetical protein